MKFIPFWFESNQAWGMISSLKDWRKIIANTRKGLKCKTKKRELLRRAKATSLTAEVESGRKKAPKEYVPNFGLYSEHRSSLTLEKWARGNGMYKMLT